MLVDQLFTATLKEYKCNLCGKVYKDKKEFMKHRKAEHLNYVSECKDNENGWFRFSGKEFWFRMEMLCLIMKGKIVNFKVRKT